MDKKENIQTARIEERKRGLDWNAWDMVFFIIIIPFIMLATLITLAPSGGISYLSGRFDVPLDFFVFILLSPPVMIVFLVPFIVIGASFVVIGFFAIIGAVRLISNWNRYANKKRLIRIIQIVISILVITVPSLSFLIPIKLYSPGYKPFTYGFRDRIRSMADVEDIRDWLRTLSEEDYTGENFIAPQSKFPESFKVLKPRYVNLDMDKNGNPKVRLTWGGGFGHWGIEIGMDDMEIPPSDFSDYGEYRLPLQPGAYVWHELQ